MTKSNAITAPRLGLVIAKRYRALSLLAEQSIANTGLCLTDFVALEALLHKGPLTISEIQDNVRLASGSMTAAVDRLEKLGLVVRKSSPSDRRARVIELTAQGKRLAASCFERRAKDLEALMSALSTGGRNNCTNCLRSSGSWQRRLTTKKPRSTAVENKLGNDRRVRGSTNKPEERTRREKEKMLNVGIIVGSIVRDRDGKPRPSQNGHTTF